MIDVKTGASPRHRKWRTLLILALASLLAMVLWFSASSVVPLLTTQWNLDDNGRAWLTLSVQIGFVVGTFISALLNLSDLLPTNKLFAVSASAGALTNALIPFAASDLTLALPMRFLTGAFSAGVYPVGMKIMATWTKEDRGLGIGLLVGALTVGSASPHLINGLGGFADWRPVMYTGSALAAVGGLLALFFVGEGPLQSQTPPFNWKFVARVWSERGLRLANFGYFGDTPHALKRGGFLGHARRRSYRPRCAPRAPSEREQIQGSIVIAVE